MTYDEFLSVIEKAKNRKEGSWIFSSPISAQNSHGTGVYREKGKVFLSVDIGPGPEKIDITNREISGKRAIREIFENIRRNK
jgi:hypothetical protein